MSILQTEPYEPGALDVEAVRLDAPGEWLLSRRRADIPRRGLLSEAARRTNETDPRSLQTAA